MGWQELKQAQIIHGDEKWPAFEGQVNLSAPGTSDWILIPDKVQNVSVTVTFTGGATGVVQTSTDRVDVVKNGTPLAIDWPYGVINADMQKACYPPSAIRIFQIAVGTMSMTIRAQ